LPLAVPPGNRQYRVVHIRRGTGADLPLLAEMELRDGRKAADLSADGGQLLVAERAGAHVGYATVDHSFFGRGFVRRLYVTVAHRRRGVGSRLLREAVVLCGTGRVFTSTNLSNGPMHDLLDALGWRPCGMVHGLDDGDPEVFYFFDADGSPVSAEGV